MSAVTLVLGSDHALLVDFEELQQVSGELLELQVGMGAVQGHRAGELETPWAWRSLTLYL